jgi:hypothetical protein
MGGPFEDKVSMMNQTGTPVETPSEAKANADIAVGGIQASTTEVAPAQALAHPEATQQAAIQADTEAAKAADADKNEEELTEGDIVHKIEHGVHNLITKVETTMKYNFHSICSCQWEGRFLTRVEALEQALKHLATRARI